MKRVLVLWGPVAAWMGVLYGFSAQSSVPGAASIPDWLTHGAAYALLGLLAARALAGGLGAPLAVGKALLAVTIASAYGVSDEYHQSFVPQRDADPYDVLKDFGGAALGVLLARELGRRAAGQESEPR